MFAVLHASPAAPLDVLVEVAQAFTPRFQVLGPFVLLDVGGLSTVFGTPAELAAAIRDACPACRSIALATTASASLLLACGREGLTVLDPVAGPTAERRALADLPVDLLIEITRARLSAFAKAPAVAETPDAARHPPSPGLPHASEPQAAGHALQAAGGWRHPRDTHQAQHVRRPRVAGGAAVDLRRALMTLQQCGATLRRWGITRLGALADLPRADVHARLGDLGVSWQRLACGEDDAPLVPWLAEPVFEAQLDLEWPIEGFEPLSFVLARLLEPLATRLELADRGATAIRTALHLTNRQTHVRVIPLPAPMRDPKTLRTLILLDLESHPPAAAIDRVQVRVEPTPGRVLQWTLFDRAQPAPEQVATLVARLTALMGETHVGSPALVDTWRPGAFVMGPFAPQPPADAPPPAAGVVSMPLAFRRFRLPIPVRVRVEDGRPIRVTTDRRGITGGAIVQVAGPWRTSGEWWEAGSGESGMQVGQQAVEVEEPTKELLASALARHERRSERPSAGRSGVEWDRDEWDIEMADGTVYRLSVEREVGQWFLEGVFD